MKTMVVQVPAQRKLNEEKNCVNDNLENSDNNINI